MQSFIANQMKKNNMIPYVMISKKMKLQKNYRQNKGLCLLKNCFIFMQRENMNQNKCNVQGGKEDVIYGN